MKTKDYTRRDKKTCVKWADNSEELLHLCRLKFEDNCDRYKYLVNLELEKCVKAGVIEDGNNIRNLLFSMDIEMTRLGKTLIKGVREKRLKNET